MTEKRNTAVVIPGHIPALDGLRAIAIIAVIFHHCGEYYLLQPNAANSFRNGLIENLGNGVDLFFALSGFLITGILLDSLDRPYFFRRFYWRRGLRIWPLYYIFLIAALLVYHRVFRGIGIAPFAFYYRNFLGPDRASDVYIGQFWSLCVEEQFYLIWPLIIFFTPRRLRIWLIVLLMSMALLLRIYLSSHGMADHVVYRLPFCHMDVLLGGAAVAILSRQGIRESLLRKGCWIAVLLGIVGLFLVGKGKWPTFNVTFLLFGLTSTSLLFGGMVGLCVRGSGRISSAILGSSFLRAISTRSYAMYVFHLVPLYASVVILSRFKKLPGTAISALLLILGIGAITYAMAWLSWRYLEEPFLRLKKWEWFVKSARPVDFHTMRSD